MEETLKPCADLLSADRNGDLSIGFYQFVNLLFWEVFVRFKPIYFIIIEKVFLRFQLERIVFTQTGNGIQQGLIS
jgi:hypothetical protein